MVLAPGPVAFYGHAMRVLSRLIFQRICLVAPTLVALSCSGEKAAVQADADTEDDAALVFPPPTSDWNRDILDYDISLDIAAMSGRLDLTLKGSASEGLSLDVGNLVIDSVSSALGPIQSLDLGRELQIGVPPGGETRLISIQYHFTSHSNFDGFIAEAELSFLWPTFCGNLFPCNPDPDEGATYSLEIQGDMGRAVYPPRIDFDAPSYMPAFAIGDYEERALGTTDAGTAISVFFEPGQEEDSLAGTLNLVAVFDFLEKTYGPYMFGNKAASVSADWGDGDFGGMEHHPFWHVARGSMASQEVHAHEAAHGWFGNGVRIACWEDFVLSEGVATYMAARALAGSGVDLWAEYDCQLRSICQSSVDTAVLLPTCGEIDIINHPLWSGAPYQKGAQFFREVSELLGEDVLDEALSEFYLDKRGKSAKMDELLALLKSKGNAAEIDLLIEAWLTSESCPLSADALCPAL